MSKPCVFSLFTAFCLSLLTAAASDAQEDVVATVNGHGITFREFRRSLLEHRAVVFSYFNHQFGAAKDQGEFWRRSFDGEVPLEKLRKLTLDASVRIKMQQLLALEKGLVRDASHAAFLSGLEEENRRRKKAARNQEAIYGPVEYSESTGFAHLFSLLVVRLKQRLADDDFEITVATLRNFYEANKEQFKQQDYVMLHGLRARDTDAQETLCRLAHQLRDGVGLTESMQDKPIGLVYFKQSLGDTAKGGEQTDDFDLPAEVRELPMGAISLFEQESELFLIQLVARREMGYYPFDDKLQRVLQRRYVDLAYERLIAQRVNEAEVVVNELVYDRVMAH